VKSSSPKPISLFFFRKSNVVMVDASFIIFEIEVVRLEADFTYFFLILRLKRLNKVKPFLRARWTMMIEDEHSVSLTRCIMNNFVKEFFCALSLFNQIYDRRDIGWPMETAQDSELLNHFIPRPPRIVTQLPPCFRWVFSCWFIDCHAITIGVVMKVVNRAISTKIANISSFKF